jgi:hypothetical protein
MRMAEGIASAGGDERDLGSQQSEEPGGGGMAAPVMGDHQRFRAQLELDVDQPPFLGMPDVAGQQDTTRGSSGEQDE